MRFAIPLMAFIPYKADAAPGVISTLWISNSVGPMAFPNGTPRVAASISTPSTNCMNRKLFGILNPLVFGTLNVRLAVIIWTPFIFSSAS